MTKVQKVSTKEFKEAAVRLAQTSGKLITRIARELGISETSILEKYGQRARFGTYDTGDFVIVLVSYALNGNLR